jgi:hypothetical protein
LCVNANRSELAPIVYDTWPNARRPNNSFNTSEVWPYNAFVADSEPNNHTLLDAIFGWRDIKTRADWNSARPGEVFYLLGYGINVNRRPSLLQVPTPRDYGE